METTVASRCGGVLCAAWNYGGNVALWYLEFTGRIPGYVTIRNSRLQGGLRDLPSAGRVA